MFLSSQASDGLINHKIKYKIISMSNKESPLTGSKSFSYGLMTSEFWFQHITHYYGLQTPIIQLPGRFGKKVVY